MSLSKNTRGFADPPQSQYQNYLLDRPQKSYLSTTKNFEAKDYKPASRGMNENLSFEAKQTPTNPTYSKANDFGDLSSNKYSSKSLNKELKTDFAGVGKKEKDTDLSVKLKDKREVDSKLSKGYEKSKMMDSFDMKYQKLVEKTTSNDVFKERTYIEDKRMERKYEQYLKDSPEKISSRKKKPLEFDVSKRPLEDNNLRKQYDEGQGLKKTMDVKKNIDFWNEKLEKYSQKDVSYSNKLDISQKKQEKKPEKSDFNFQKESEYIKELKKSLYSKDNKEKEQKNMKMNEFDKQFNEKMRLNFEEKGLFKKDWAFNLDEKPKKTVETPVYGKADITMKPQKPEVSSKKMFDEGKQYKDFTRPTYQDIKADKYSPKQKTADIYEKKLLAVEKPEEKKPNIYQQMELEREREKLKKNTKDTRETVEMKSYDTAMVESLKKKKEELESQVKDLSHKLTSVQANNAKQDFHELENKLKEAQREIYDLRRKTEESVNKAQDYEQHVDVLNSQIAELKQSLSRGENDRQQLKSTNEKLQRESQDYSRIQNEVKNIKAEVSKEQKLKESLLRDLKSVEEQKKNTENELKEANLRLEEFKMVKDRLEKSEKAKFDLNNKVKTLNEELEKARKTGELDVLREELERIKTENARSNRMRETLQNELQETSNKYEEMQRGLIDEIEAFKDNQEKLLEENRDLSQKINELNEQYNKFLEEFNEKEQQYIQEIQELKEAGGNTAGGIPQEELLEIFKGFEEEKADIQRRYEDLEKEHMDLLSKSKKNDEVDTLRRQNKEMEVKFNEERRNYEGIIRENDENLKKMREFLENLNEDVTRFQDANGKLTNENERILGEYDALQGEMEALAKLNAQYEENMQKLQEDNTAMAQFLEQHNLQTEDNNNLAGKIAELESNHQEEVQKLQKKINDMQQERALTEKTLKEKAQTEGLFEDKVNDLTNANIALEEELQNLKMKYDSLMEHMETNNPAPQGSFKPFPEESVGVNEEMKTRIHELEEQELEYQKVLEAMKVRMQELEDQESEYHKLIEDQQLKHQNDIDKLIEDLQLKHQNDIETLRKESDEKKRILEQDFQEKQKQMQAKFDETLRENQQKPGEENKDDFEVITGENPKIDNKYEDLLKEQREKIKILEEASEFMVMEYEQKHSEVLAHEREKFEVMQEKFLRKLDALRQENEVFREHIMNNPQLLENKENKVPKGESSEMQTIPFLVEEYELKYKMAMEAEREKFRVCEEKYIKKVQDLQELLMNQPNF